MCSLVVRRLRPGLRDVAGKADLVPVNLDDMRFFDSAEFFDKLFHEPKHLGHISRIKLLYCLERLREHVSSSLAAQHFRDCSANQLLFDCWLRTECFNLCPLVQDSLLHDTDLALLELFFETGFFLHFLLQMPDQLLVMSLLGLSLEKLPDHLIKVYFKSLKQMTNAVGKHWVPRIRLTEHLNKAKRLQAATVSLATIAVVGLVGYLEDCVTALFVAFVYRKSRVAAHLTKR